MNDVTGKVVWITGASSGIGQALAYALAKRGAKLVLSARREQELLRVKEGCSDAATVVILTMDVTATYALSQKIEWVLAEMGSIDMLILCAGVSQRSFAVNTSPDVFRKIMEINYFGTIALANVVLPHFLQRNKGQFVVMSSVTGKIGLPLRTGYSASKHALEGFFGALRTETWKTGIKILVVRAGAVKTKIAQNALVGDGAAFNQKDEIIENGIAPEACADAIVKAIVENRKEIVVGSAKEKLLFVINRFLPGVAFNLVKKLGDKR